MKPQFEQKLTDSRSALRHLCVGLDPVWDRIPLQFKDRGSTSLCVTSFCIDRIEATKDVAACYKPNVAFFVKVDKDSGTLDGTRALHQVCEYLAENHPRIPVILDTKDADIGKTNHGYVKRAMQLAGAVTLSPYLGEEALRPFLDSDLSCIMLARTSNDGADEFQNRLTQIIPGELRWYKDTESPVSFTGESTAKGSYFFAPHYQVVASRIAHAWQSKHMRGIVAGATAPSELGNITDVITRETLMLIPGIGAQGGDLEAVMAQLKARDHKHFVINSSSGIIFADDPAQAALEQDRAIREFLW